MRRFLLPVMVAALSHANLHAASSARAELPLALHGEWTTEPDLCHANPPMWALWQISADTLLTQEGGADVLRVRALPGQPQAFDVLLKLSGGGQVWTASVRMIIDQRGMAMEIKDRNEASALPNYLWRCADPIPAQFLGEWAYDSENCGVEYASQRLTPSGFRMPEIGERTLLVAASADNPAELVMEAVVSIAGSTYEERRVLRLSPDGTQMSVVSLGQIERASEDPDWQPNPYARFRAPADPERTETLYRCP